MKKLSFLLVIFFFVYPGDAQYLEYIAGYNLYFFKLNEGQIMPEPDEVIKQDTTLTIAWQRGAGDPYISPYTSILDTMVWVENTPGLWDNDTTSSSQSIPFTNGMYELVATEVDTLQNQSPYSNPLFIEFRGVFARVPINLQIMK